ncbi:MAG TPA: helix-hairpin-helix domain-containing protein [Candidatus Acidoferrum sp.]|nr:helix-hairpin-helix domain-containing protein [Candidatus Acidoferrum sp.]
MAWRSFAIRASLIFCLLFVPGVLAKEKPPAQPVNINVASSEELQLVPGIGPSTAEKILQMRKSYGPFKSVDDLLAIRGLGPKRLEKMRKYLVAGKPTSKNASPAMGCPGCAKPKAPPPKSPAKISAPPAASQSARDEDPPL